MNTTYINIATACDNAYVQHTVVLLKSLYAKNPNIRSRVFVLVPDDFNQHAALQRNLGENGKNIEFLSVNLSETSKLLISLGITVATYFRLFLDRLLPTDVERIIYLDSDILIDGGLEDLWTTELGDYAIAAATDSCVDTDDVVRGKLGLGSKTHYFNAGVMLIDLQRWRNQRLGERALAFANEHPELITWWDQCALNYVLNGRFKELSKDWNFQTDHLQWSDRGKCSEKTLVDLRRAKIVHFTGRLKPWHYHSEHPKKWLYWKFLHETEWRNYRPPDRTGRNVLVRNLELRSPTLLKLGRQLKRYWRR